MSKWENLENGTCFVGAAFEGLNAKIMKWGFDRTLRLVSSCAPYNFCLKWSRIEKVIEETLTVCFLSWGVMTEDK